MYSCGVVPRSRVVLVQFLCREGSIGSSSGICNSVCGFFNRETSIGRSRLGVFPIYAGRCIVGFTTRPRPFRASLVTSWRNFVIFLPTPPFEHFYRRQGQIMNSFGLCTNLNQALPLHSLPLFIQRPSRLVPHLISGRQQGTAKLYSFFSPSPPPSQTKIANSFCQPQNPIQDTQGGGGGGKEKGGQALTIRTSLNNRSRKS